MHGQGREFYDVQLWPRVILGYRLMISLKLFQIGVCVFLPGVRNIYFLSMYNFEIRAN